jgi:hypothetical protein
MAAAGYADWIVTAYEADVSSAGAPTQDASPDSGSCSRRRGTALGFAAEFDRRSNQANRPYRLV